MAMRYAVLLALTTVVASQALNYAISNSEGKCLCPGSCALTTGPNGTIDIGNTIGADTGGSDCYWIVPAKTKELASVMVESYSTFVPEMAGSPTYAVDVGPKLPTLVGGSSPLNATSILEWGVLANTMTNDNVGVEIPDLGFNFCLEGRNIRNSMKIYPGGFITFADAGPNITGPLSVSNPAVPTLFLGAHMGSWQTIAFKNATLSPSETGMIIRFEGRTSPDNASAPIDVIMEITIMQDNKIKVASATNHNPLGLWTFADGMGGYLIHFHPILNSSTTFTIAKKCPLNALNVYTCYDSSCKKPILIGPMQNGKRYTSGGALLMVATVPMPSKTPTPQYKVTWMEETALCNLADPTAMQCADKYKKAYGCGSTLFQLPLNDPCYSYVTMGCVKQMCESSCPTDPMTGACLMPIMPGCEAKCGFPSNTSLCAPGCHTDMVADNMCDFACMTSKCFYDGGDCTMTKESMIPKIHAQADTNLDGYVDASEYTRGQTLYGFPRDVFMMADTNSDDKLTSFELAIAFFTNMYGQDTIDKYLESKAFLDLASMAPVRALFTLADTNMDGLMDPMEAHMKYGITALEMQMIARMGSALAPGEAAQPPRGVPMMALNHVIMGVMYGFAGRNWELKTGFDMKMAVGIFIKLADSNMDGHVNKHEAVVLSISGKMYDSIVPPGKMMDAMFLYDLIMIVSTDSCMGTVMVDDREMNIDAKIPLVGGMARTCSWLVLPNWFYPAPEGNMTWWSGAHPKLLSAANSHHHYSHSHPVLFSNYVSKVDRGSFAHYVERKVAGEDYVASHPDAKKVSHHTVRTHAAEHKNTLRSLPAANAEMERENVNTRAHEEFVAHAPPPGTPQTVDEKPYIASVQIQRPTVHCTIDEFITAGVAEGWKRAKTMAMAAAMNSTRRLLAVPEPDFTRDKPCAGTQFDWNDAMYVMTAYDKNMDGEIDPFEAWCLDPMDFGRLVNNVTVQSTLPLAPGSSGSISANVTVGMIRLYAEAMDFKILDLNGDGNISRAESPLPYAIHDAYCMPMGTECMLQIEDWHYINSFASVMYSEDLGTKFNASMRWDAIDSNNDMMIGVNETYILQNVFVMIFNETVTPLKLAQVEAGMQVHYQRWKGCSGMGADFLPYNPAGPGTTFPTLRTNHHSTLEHKTYSTNHKAHAEIRAMQQAQAQTLVAKHESNTRIAYVVQDYWHHTCTATLVEQAHLLTSYMCAKWVNDALMLGTPVRVVLGQMSNPDNTTWNHETADVKQVMFHPMTLTEKGWDVAVLKLDTMIMKTKPVMLYAGQDLEFTDCHPLQLVATGFDGVEYPGFVYNFPVGADVKGVNDTRQDSRPMIREVALKAVDQKSCVSAYEAITLVESVHEENLCADSPEPFCIDSGSALVVPDPKHPMNSLLVGILTGDGCKPVQDVKPGVFTRITAVRQWVLAMIKPLAVHPANALSLKVGALQIPLGGNLWIYKGASADPAKGEMLDDKCIDKHKIIFSDDGMGSMLVTLTIPPMPAVAPPPSPNLEGRKGMVTTLEIKAPMCGGVPMGVGSTINMTLCEQLEGCKFYNNTNVHSCMSPTCKMEQSWEKIADLAKMGKAFNGGLGKKAVKTAWEHFGVWTCLRDWDMTEQIKCGVRPGELACFRFEENNRKWHYYGLNSEQMLVSIRKAEEGTMKELDSIARLK